MINEGAEHCPYHRFLLQQNMSGIFQQLLEVYKAQRDNRNMSEDDAVSVVLVWSLNKEIIQQTEQYQERADI